MKKKVVAPSNLSLVDLHLCQKNKCIIFVSYICIAAFHLGTIGVPREGCDVETEPEDGEWWTRLEDGQMDPDGQSNKRNIIMINFDV